MFDSEVRLRWRHWTVSLQECCRMVKSTVSVQNVPRWIVRWYLCQTSSVVNIYSCYWGLWFSVRAHQCVLGLIFRKKQYLLLFISCASFEQNVVTFERADADVLNTGGSNWPLFTTWLLCMLWPFCHSISHILHYQIKLCVYLQHMAKSETSLHQNGHHCNGTS